MFCLGADFEATKATVLFPSGSGLNMTECIPINIVDDFSVESIESFFVFASGGKFIPHSQATVIIQDDDGKLCHIIQSSENMNQSSKK